MQGVWLSAAAGLTLAAAAVSPAEAGGSGQGVTSGGSHFGASTGQPDSTARGRDRSHHRRGHRDSGGTVIVGDWGDGDWGRYNNRAFDADSYNDWWHERPWRSYPRWVTNGSCERVWWGGGGWRCTR